MPAATHGHGPERNREVDAHLSPEAIAAGCRDFAEQLTDRAAALGGGRDLVAEWHRRPASVAVWNATPLAAVNHARVTYLAPSIPGTWITTTTAGRSGSTSPASPR